MERKEEKNQGLETQKEWNHKEDSTSGFLNVHQIANYLGIKVSTLYTMVEERKIPHYRVGRLVRFKKGDVDAWMDNQKEEVVDARVEARKIFGPIKKNGGLDVDRTMKKVIEQPKKKRYNFSQEKPGEIEGLETEVRHGII